MKRSEDQEMMDQPGQPRELLEEDLGHLRHFNRYLGGYRSVLGGLERLVQKEKINRFSLLDVGTGSGDIPMVIARWARSREITANLVALEREPVTAQVAATLTRQTNPPFIPLSQRLPSTVIAADPPNDGSVRSPVAEAGIQRENEGDFRSRAILVVRGDGCAPPFRSASFDFVLASQFLHHFPDDKIVALLRTWSKLARKAIIISDLVRHPLAYHGIRLVTKLITRNVMTLTDAPLSVQRAFTIKEWRELFRRADVGALQVISFFPFRIVALISLSA